MHSSLEVTRDLDADTLHEAMHGASLDLYVRSSAASVSGELAFTRHYMRRLLYRIAVSLPRLFEGQHLIRESGAIKQRCWRELGYEKQPVFDGDLPAFLMVDGDGYPVALSSPADPVELATRLSALEPSPPPVESCIGTNLDTLARLLSLTPFELQWLRWSYCVRRFGRAILPPIPLRDAMHGCDVLALLCEMPLDNIRDAVTSRRLHTWGFLDGGDVAGAMPCMLSGWLSATDRFADWIEQPYASVADLMKALCQAQVSLMASR